MLVSRKRRAALLVDFDNVVTQSGSQLADAIGNWFAWLEDGGFDPRGVRRDFLVRRVYWNVANDTAHRLKFKKHKFETRLCRAVRNKDKASSADFDITIDAVELRHEHSRLEEVVVLTFDSDFLTVLNHLQVHDIEVVGMARGDDRPARAYRELADYVIEHEAFVGACAYERKSRGLLASARIGAKPKAADDPAPSAPKPNPPASTRGTAKEAASAPWQASATATSRAPQAPTKSVPGARGRSARAAKTDGRLTKAAELVAQAASASPSAMLSRRFVCRALEKFDGFRTTPPSPWLGCANYQAMIRQFPDLNLAFEIVEQANGAVHLVYRGPEEGAHSRV